MQDEMMNVWNVHGMDEGGVKLSNRTSNGLERYNRHFNGIYPNNHPNLVTFVSKLKEEVGGQVQRIENVRKGREDPPDYQEVVFTLIPDSFADFRDKFGESKKKKKAGGRKRAGKRG